MPSAYAGCRFSPGYSPKAGESGHCFGNVTGSLPDGFCAPKRISPMACPASWPPYQACTTAGTRPIHFVMVTGAPATITTMVFLLAAAAAPPPPPYLPAPQPSGTAPAPFRHGDRRSRDNHYDGVLVGRGDRLDELVLTGRQIHRRAVETLRLELVGELG